MLMRKEKKMDEYKMDEYKNIYGLKELFDFYYKNRKYIESKDLEKQLRKIHEHRIFYGQDFDPIIDKIDFEEYEDINSCYELKYAEALFISFSDEKHIAELMDKYEDDLIGVEGVILKNVLDNSKILLESKKVIIRKVKERQQHVCELVKEVKKCTEEQFKPTDLEKKETSFTFSSYTKKVEYLDKLLNYYSMLLNNRLLDLKEDEQFDDLGASDKELCVDVEYYNFSDEYIWDSAIGEVLSTEKKWKEIEKKLSNKNIDITEKLSEIVYETLNNTYGMNVLLPRAIGVLKKYYDLDMEQLYELLYELDDYFLEYNGEKYKSNALKRMKSYIEFSSIVDEMLMGESVEDEDRVDNIKSSYVLGLNVLDIMESKGYDRNSYLDLDENIKSCYEKLLDLSRNFDAKVFLDILYSYIEEEDRSVFDPEHYNYEVVEKIIQKLKQATYFSDIGIGDKSGKWNDFVYPFRGEVDKHEEYCDTDSLSEGFGKEESTNSINIEKQR